MEYISTRNTTETFSFKDVFLNGLASDGGLYVPKSIPKYSLKDLDKLKSLSYFDLASKIVSIFCRDVFSEKEISSFIKNSYKSFRNDQVVNIKTLEKLYILELFHGPTLAFKDIAMQGIGNMYENILKKNNLKINLIVATSGDTGAAAIDAVKNRPNIKIFVLHPENKISKIQRKFMTTVNAPNVFNIAINGNFDDCQDIIKSIFNDKNFRKKINISGVNSINWARIVFQIVYYFFSYFKIANNYEKINFSIPTGNFGDAYAGYVAKKMGLPINKLIIATNTNDILKKALNTGHYKPSIVEHTVSPSMDIQVASNFERLIFNVSSLDKKIIDLMDNLKTQGEYKIENEDLKKIKLDFEAESLTEEQTINTIKNVYEKHEMLVDPHTAVGIGVANKVSLKEKIIVLSTAHPAKFPETVLKSTSKKPELPPNLNDLLNKEEKFEKLPNNLENIKNYILQSAK